MCTVGLTTEIKLRFTDGFVCTVGLTAEIKLRFTDGLVCTVGVTAETKQNRTLKVIYFRYFIVLTY